MQAFRGIKRGDCQADKERKKETRIDLSVYDIQPILRYKFEGYQMCLCTHLFENYTVPLFVVVSSIVVIKSS